MLYLFNYFYFSLLLNTSFTQQQQQQRLDFNENPNGIDTTMAQDPFVDNIAIKLFNGCL